ncbi:hypothetical protein HELRODRAFT_105275 [Helobdella robusta]|uniref:Sodium/nucleoside cotransporter n=1 Tax=Helobdella robusta TaxID=6412 RepID=T1EDS7_HELRO|nr:hypothetical protein HELRODRAFT_105275 [Helobdella robusta]ESO12303.1 hypothetical protein HELRODRAFT_105275 [Helobdella robusta]
MVIISDLYKESAQLYNLVSLTGLALYVFIMFFFSKHPSKIKWLTVAWGFALQFAFALIILRWSLGFHIFKWLSDRVANYMKFVQTGCLFLFGPNYSDHLFVMQVLPTVVFISATINIMFYLGIMQKLIVGIALTMKMLMNTTAPESVATAGNIFLGQTECLLLVKPLLKYMTKSEIHAVMSGGFATIAGGVLGAFILFGVPANHLISASVMSAPAALAISKLFYPETKKTKTSAEFAGNIKSQEKSLFEAASAGAKSGMSLVVSIGANLLVFISLLSVINSTLTWFGERVGSTKPITFQFVLSYLLWPFALTMGVKLEDCRKVGELMGIKTFINEFVAFQELGVLINNRKELNEHIAKNGTWSSERSVVISTYALCGFSNFGSIGVQLSLFMALIPSRKSMFAEVALRSMISGSVACFVTACIASDRILFLGLKNEINFLIF